MFRAAFGRGLCRHACLHIRPAVGAHQFQHLSPLGASLTTTSLAEGRSALCRVSSPGSPGPAPGQPHMASLESWQIEAEGTRWIGERKSISCPRPNRRPDRLPSHRATRLETRFAVMASKPQGPLRRGWATTAGLAPTAAARAEPMPRWSTGASRIPVRHTLPKEETPASPWPRIAGRGMGGGRHVRTPATIRGRHPRRPCPSSELAALDRRDGACAFGQGRGSGRWTRRAADSRGGTRRSTGIRAG